MVTQKPFHILPQNLLKEAAFHLLLLDKLSLGVRFGVGVKLPRLKLIKIMLETWNLVHTHAQSHKIYLLVPRPS